ncbi:ABC transporter permease [Paracoccus sp. (in: a-proteobacteria)]|uniref:ABC transporter permease n=1 Tax=Paracoccus sp. TaxID=267 RepID=UPI003A8AF554
MQNFRIALRNIFRNKRRTFMAMASIIVGVVALALISGFVATIRYSLYTSIVRAEGHVQIMAEHYLDLGSSNPGKFYVEDWEGIARQLEADPELGPQISVIAPMLTVAGVAGNAETGASRSYMGAGYRADLFAAMQEWDNFNLRLDRATLPLDPEDPDVILVGVGLAQQLQICSKLNVPGCVDYDVVDEPEGEADAEIADLGDLVSDELAVDNAGHEGMPVVDLMAAAASGAPNARSVWVGGIAEQARRQADNSYVAMDLRTAQNLIYEDQNHVSHVMVQFRSNDFAARGLERIREILADGPQRLDVLELENFNETFTRVVGMFTVIQMFIGIVVGLIILFMIANTMAIVVMERVNEIGTIRALGQTRGGVLRLFLMEGVLLGALSATVGLAVSWVVILIVNNSGLSFVTPTSTSPIPVRILFTEAPATVAGIWLMITAVATLSSLLPARRAARFRIVDALRFA